jgi:hypothetical protein
MNFLSIFFWTSVPENVFSISVLNPSVLLLQENVISEQRFSINFEFSTGLIS